MDSRLSNKSAEELARQWIEMSGKLSHAVRESKAYELAPDEPDFSMLGEDDPELAWRIILDILNRFSSSNVPLDPKSDAAKVLGHLSASMLEDLLNAHGEQFVDRVETLASDNLQFRWMLGAVWPGPEMSETLRRRLELAAKSAQ